MKKLALLAGAALVLAAAAAYAQMGPRHDMPPRHGPMMSQHMGHGSGHGMTGHDANAHSRGPKGDNGPSSLAFHAINNKMHEGMDITFTGNADVDFIKGMVPHHQGAVDMAKTVLAFGKDAEVKKLAGEIIAAQEREIAWMREWLNNNAR